MNLLILASCSSPEINNRDHLVFRYNEHANITSLDPAFAKDQRNIWPAHQMYNTLVNLDSNLYIAEDLAHSWTIYEVSLT